MERGKNMNMIPMKRKIKWYMKVNFWKGKETVKEKSMVLMVICYINIAMLEKKVE